MKKYRVTLFVLLVVILSACRGQTIHLPEGTDESVLISHLKDTKLSVMSEDGESVTQTEIEVSVAGIARIDSDRVAFTTKDQSPLYLLDTSSGDLKEWEQVGSGVNELLYDSDSGYLYLADSVNSSVQVFDTEKGEVIEEVMVGQLPLSMAADEEGMLYVVNQKSSTVSVINMENHQVEREYPVPYLPEGIWVRDQKVYIGGHGPVHGELNRYVYELDAKSGEQLSRIQVGLMPVKLFSPESSSDLFVVCHGSHEVYKLPFSNPENSERLEVGANPYDMTGDGGALYVSNVDSDSLSIIDPVSFQIVKEVSIEGGPAAIVKGGDPE
ncbi:YncE family protein [Halobacillus litoralis]|uniref:YncE family protein n=1 Tax=Halobacillus litoralis TaxID=45668 RepID=UPI001CD1AB84|nr:YncE family protein [Halobacillus litoralis]MCA0970550.1 YncE family protein [Halobacillus litoralis]